MDSVKERGTQDEVRQELGPPKAIRQAEGGESVWVYELVEQKSGNRFTAPGVGGEQYLLTFDDKAVFQRWRQIAHFHGGELMPTECNPGSGAAEIIGTGHSWAVRATLPCLSSCISDVVAERKKEDEGKTAGSRVEGPAGADESGVL